MTGGNYGRCFNILYHSSSSIYSIGSLIMGGEYEAADKLAKMYQDSFDTILARVIKKTKAGKYAGRDVALLDSITNEINKLNLTTVKFADQVIDPVYNRERIAVIKSMEGFRESLPGFDRVHGEAIKLLKSNFTEGVISKNQIVGRQVNDYLRTEGMSVAQKLSTGALTKKGAIEEFVKNLDGQMYVTYANGAKVHVVDYAKMSINTTIDSSINRAVINSNEEYDNDLVQLSSHSSSCPICAPYQGRVYSISGKSKEYPALSEVNNESMLVYGVIHPNCRHRTLPYVLELDSDAEENKRLSNMPFEDNRTEFSKERYTKRQNINRLTKEKQKLKRENDALKALPKTDETKQLIASNNAKIKTRGTKIKEIKKWEKEGLEKNDLSLIPLDPRIDGGK